MFGEDEDLDAELNALLNASEEDEEEQDEEKGEKPADEEPAGEDDENEEGEDEESEAGSLLSSLGLSKGDAPPPRQQQEERPAPTTQQQAQHPEVAEFLNKVATGNDPVSMFLQGLVKHSHTTQRRVDDLEAMLDIKPRLRSLVKAEYQTGDYRTVAAAHRAVLGKLVSGELKPPTKPKAAKPKADAAPKKPLTETFVSTGTGRKPNTTRLSELKEVDEGWFNKHVLDNPAPTQLTQRLYRRWRSGDLKLTTRRNNTRR